MSESMREKDQAEILAPAGSYTCMKAAFAAGADAVYVGGDRYSARAYAANFNQDELIKAIDYAHICGKKLYLTVNILLKESELGRSLIEWLTPLYEHGLDAVIIQDLGLIRVLKEMFPDLPVHASTQMSVTSSAAMRLLKKNGISRVIPARELSLEEIRKLCEEGGPQVEAFVHGAMCYAYSGKCLFSSMMGERSGNRGRCAQPCRLSYKAPCDRDEKYRLSMQDLCMIKRIPDLIKAGVSSFKIEGRMKSEAYVYTVTRLYRKYTDLYTSRGASGYAVSDEDMELLRSFSRKQTGEGYSFTHGGPQMITVDDPSFRAGTEDTERLSVPELSPVKVNAKVCMREGKRASLRIRARGHEVEVLSVNAVQKAIKAPLSVESLTERFSKTGDEAFQIYVEEVCLDGDVFLPVREQNEMRRKAIFLLRDELLKEFYRNMPESPYEDAPKASTPSGGALKRADQGRRVNVLISTPEQAEAVLEDPYVTDLSVESSMLNTPDDLRTLTRAAHSAARPKRIFAALPHIARPDGDPAFIPRVFDRDFLTSLEEADGVMIRNLDEAAWLPEAGYDGKMIADYWLYAFNSESICFLRQNGISGICYSPEMHRLDIAQTEKRLLTSSGGLQAIGRDVSVYGYIPRMLSAQCLVKNTDHCRKCSGSLVMTDRRGGKFTVQNRCDSCYNIIYNQVPLSLHTKLSALEDFPSVGMRLDFTFEKSGQVREILKLFLHEGSVKAPAHFTKGHWDKGVL